MITREDIDINKAPMLDALIKCIETGEHEGDAVMCLPCQRTIDLFYTSVRGPWGREGSIDAVRSLATLLGIAFETVHIGHMATGVYVAGFLPLPEGREKWAIPEKFEAKTKDEATSRLIITLKAYQARLKRNS